MSIAHLVDLIIVLVAVEAIGLVVYRQAKQRGMPRNEVLSFLGAGAGLMLALRVLVSDGSFVLFGAAMLFSLSMHLWHVRQRWQ